MDDTGNETRYPTSPYGVNEEQGYSDGSSGLRKDLYFGVVDNEYGDDDGAADDDGCDDDDGGDDNDDDNGDEGEVAKDGEDGEQLGEEDSENNQSNGVSYVGKYVDNEDDEDNKDEGTDEEEDDDDDDDAKSSDDADLKRHPKKRKMKSLISSYEFAPRVPPSLSAALVLKPHVSGRNPLTDWTENETFVLLDAWGNKFVQRGRKSLRSDEWHEVAEKVSAVSKIERTDTQCRNRLDTLKKKYKKEKSKLEEPGGDSPSKWVYFKKMDMLISASTHQSGLDSGKYVSRNPKLYLNCANEFEKIQVSPDNSAPPNDKDDSGGLPPKKRRSGRDHRERSSFRLLADSIEKFSNIYEKIEKKRRQQLQELEEMRMNFQRDLEKQRRQIMERAHPDMSKIHHDDQEENNISTDIASG